MAPGVSGLGRVAIPGSAFAPVIVVIPYPADGCKPGAFDGEWLPRICPRCGAAAVIGHGRRSRQAHDRDHDSIRIRRGLCNRCRLTLTVLPAWCVPGAPYNLPARQEALGRLAERETLEDSAPICLDPDRIADPSTIRRWFWRRIASLGAEKARQIFDALKSQVEEDSADGSIEIGSHSDRFSRKMLDLLGQVKIFDLRPDELEQLGYDHSLKIDGAKLVLTTDESDVSAFLKIMVDHGARVEVYSAHQYSESEYGRGK